MLIWRAALLVKPLRPRIGHVESPPFFNQHPFKAFVAASDSQARLRRTSAGPDEKQSSATRHQCWHVVYEARPSLAAGAHTLDGILPNWAALPPGIRRHLAPAAAWPHHQQHLIVANHCCRGAPQASHITSQSRLDSLAVSKALHLVTAPIHSPDAKRQRRIPWPSAPLFHHHLPTDLSTTTARPTAFHCFAQSNPPTFLTWACPTSPLKQAHASFSTCPSDPPQFIPPPAPAAPASTSNTATLAPIPTPTAHTPPIPLMPHDPQHSTITNPPSPSCLPPSAYILPDPTPPAPPPPPTPTSILEAMIAQAPTWAHLHLIISQHLLEFDARTLACAWTALAALLPPGPAHHVQGVAVLLTQLDTITPSRLPSAKPHQLLSMLNAWARMGCTTALPAALACLSRCALITRPSSMDGTTATDLLHSLAILRVRDQTLLTVILRACARDLAGIDPERRGKAAASVVQVVSDAAGVERSSRDMLAECSGLAAQLVTVLALPQLAILATAFVQGGVVHDAFLAGAARQLAARLGRAEQARDVTLRRMREQLQDATHLCWALAAAGFHDADLLRHVAKVVTPQLPELPALATVYVCAAHGECSQHNPELFSVAAAHVARCALLMSPSDLASMCAAFAAVEHRDDGALDAIMEATASRLRSCSVGAVTSIAEACASLGYLPAWYADVAAKVVLALPAQHAASREAVGSAVSAAWALAAAGQSGSSGEFRRLVLRMLEVVSAAWPEAGGQLPLDAHQAAQVAAVGIACGGGAQLLAEHLPLEALQFVMSAWEGSEVRSPGASSDRESVRRVLMGMGLEVECEVEVLGGLLAVPLVVHHRRGKMVALEWWGAGWCASNGDRELLGAALLRQRLLQQCGVGVAGVREAEWMEEEGEQGWRWLLKGRVSDALSKARAGLTRFHQVHHGIRRAEYHRRRMAREYHRSRMTRARAFVKDGRR